MNRQAWRLSHALPRPFPLIFSSSTTLHSSDDPLTPWTQHLKQELQILSGLCVRHKDETQTSPQQLNEKSLHAVSTICHTSPTPRLKALISCTSPPVWSPPSCILFLLRFKSIAQTLSIEFPKMQGFLRYHFFFKLVQLSPYIVFIWTPSLHLLYFMAYFIPLTS